MLTARVMYSPGFAAIFGVDPATAVGVSHDATLGKQLLPFHM